MLLKFIQVSPCSDLETPPTTESRRDWRQDSDMGEPIGPEVPYLPRSTTCHTQGAGDEKNERAKG